MSARFESALPYRPPLAWNALLEFLSLRAIPGVERVSPSRYQRTIALERAVGTIRVEMDDSRALLGLRADLVAESDGRPIVERVRRLFDLDADPAAIGVALGRDRRLAGMVGANPGLRVPGCWDGFELAVRAVLGQQVTVRGASTLAARLVRAYGEPVGGTGAGELSHLFPTARALQEADAARVGLPQRRAATIRRLAREVVAGRLSFEPAQDRREFVSAMTALPGIGDWTAQYIAMRALKDPDAFPASDLVLRRAAACGGAKLSAKQLAGQALAWRPWRAYAAVYLWKASV